MKTYVSYRKTKSCSDNSGICRPLTCQNLCVEYSAQIAEGF